MINVVRSYTESDDLVELDVSESGLDLTVAAGSFAVKGQSYDLAEDQQATVSPHATSPTWVAGYLAQHRESGEVALVVDEVVYGSGDEALDFGATEYELLHRLFTARVQAGAMNLSDIQVSVFHLVSLEE